MRLLASLYFGICRFTLRFLLLYFVCFIFPFPFSIIQYPAMFVPADYQPAWMKYAYADYINPAFGKVHQWQTDIILKVGNEYLEKYLDHKIVLQLTGSGDSMRNYVGCLCAFVVALAGAIAWTVAISLIGWLTKRPWLESYLDRFAYTLVTILLRLFLCQMLLSYGFAKFFPNQFPLPTWRVDQTFGTFSPMGILWTFMGVSPPYQIFTGAVEVLAGLLLIPRRMVFLGSIVSTIAMAQIVLLNLCYDVPVKLYSMHYLAMSLFLLAPYLPRFVKACVLQQQVPAEPIRPRCGSEVIDWFLLILRTLFLGMLLGVHVTSNGTRWMTSNGLDGVWEKLPSETKEEMHADVEMNWQKLDFTMRGGVTIYGDKPPALRYKLNYNSPAPGFTLKKFSDPTWFRSFQYELKRDETLGEILILKGEHQGQPLTGRFKKLEGKKHEIFNRGFHWISEIPYNR